MLQLPILTASVVLACPYMSSLGCMVYCVRTTCGEHLPCGFLLRVVTSVAFLVMLLRKVSEVDEDDLKTSLRVRRTEWAFFCFINVSYV